MKDNNKNGAKNRRHIAIISILYSLLIVTCSLMLIACSDPLAEEGPSKGTIILNFGGVSVTSRAVTMANIVYNYKLFDLDDPDDSDGMKYNGTLNGGKITVDPGNYRIRLTAYLNDAFYAEGDTTDPVQVTAGSSTPVSIALTVHIDLYLEDTAFAGVNVIDMPLAVALSDNKWGAILTTIGDKSRPVNLDLSQCRGTFNPTIGSSTGKSLIRSLILPNGIQTIGDNAFADYSSLGEITFPNSLTDIGDYAFMDNSLISVTIPEGVNIGNQAFDGNSILNTIDIRYGCTIGSKAFMNCGQITSVTIGTGVRYSGMGTGIHGEFDRVADPSYPSNGLQAGIYAWDGTTWNHTP